MDLFIWATLTPDLTLDSKLQELFDAAIRYGISNQPSEELKNKLTARIISIWERGFGFKGKILVNLRTMADASFENRLNLLAKTHDVKEGFFAKLFSKDDDE